MPKFNTGKITTNAIFYRGGVPNEHLFKCAF